jgi:hypothetical protein
VPGATRARALTGGLTRNLQSTRADETRQHAAPLTREQPACSDAVPEVFV